MSSDEDRKVEASEEEEEPQGLMMQVIMSVLKPGSSLTPTMHFVMNVLFGVVGFVLAIQLFFDQQNIHYYVMLSLLMGLALSTNWFFSLLLDEDGEAVEESAADAKEETKKDK